MRLEINGTGRFLIQKQTKEIIEFIWSGILFSAVFYLGIRYGLEGRAFQLIMYIWVSIFAIITSIFIPINLKNKIKKVILKIEFLENQIKIETNKGVFYLKKIQVNKAIGRFTGFGKEHTNGYILQDSNDKKEYWLIETFFNEMEDIEIELKKYM